MKLIFDNFQAEISGTKKDFVKYLALKNSLPVMFETARIGCICATVTKDNEVQLVKRVGLKEKNNGKEHRDIRNGWEYFSPFKPSKVECKKTRVKYWTVKYLHKNILLSKKENVSLQLDNGDFINGSGVYIWEYLENFRSNIIPEKVQNQQVETNCPF